jgi:DNA-binding IclR family transcriptional regulator
MDPVLIRRIRILLFILRNPGTVRRAIEREFNLSTPQARRCAVALEEAGLVESRPTSAAPTATRELHSTEQVAQVATTIAIAALQELDQLHNSLQALNQRSETRLAELENQLREMLGG